MVLVVDNDELLVMPSYLFPQVHSVTTGAYIECLEEIGELGIDNV